MDRYSTASISTQKSSKLRFARRDVGSGGSAEFDGGGDEHSLHCLQPQNTLRRLAPAAKRQHVRQLLALRGRECLFAYPHDNASFDDKLGKRERYDGVIVRQHAEMVFLKCGRDVLSTPLDDAHLHVPAGEKVFVNRSGFVRGLRTETRPALTQVLPKPFDDSPVTIAPVHRQPMAVVRIHH